VIRYLHAARHAFLMPLPWRGRKLDHPNGPSGSCVFAAYKRSGWSRYTLTDAHKRTATVAVCERVVRVRGVQAHGVRGCAWSFTCSGWS
jgi:hypothetical protein